MAGEQRVPEVPSGTSYVPPQITKPWLLFKQTLSISLPKKLSPGAFLGLSSRSNTSELYKIRGCFPGPKVIWTMLYRELGLNI